MHSSSFSHWRFSRLLERSQSSLCPIIVGDALLVHILHEGIKLGSPNGEVLGITLRDDDGNTFVLDEGIELGFSIGPFDGSNDGKLEGKLLGDSLGTDEGTELGSLDGYNDDNIDGSRLGVSLGSTDGFIPGTD